MFHLEALKAVLLLMHVTITCSRYMAQENPFRCSFRNIPIQIKCIGLHTFRQWFCVTLLANLDFYFCLRVKFHKSSFWIPILAAEGPYLMKSWVPISMFAGPYQFYP